MDYYITTKSYSLRIWQGIAILFIMSGRIKLNASSLNLALFYNLRPQADALPPINKLGLTLRHEIHQLQRPAGDLHTTCHQDPIRRRDELQSNAI